MDEFIGYFDLEPRIVPADQVSVITLRPRFRHAAFPADAGRLAVTLGGLDGLHCDGAYGGNCGHNAVRHWELLPDGSLRIEAFFPGEQEFNLTVEVTEPGNRDADSWALRAKARYRFGLYSLKPDLFALRPFRGDFHMHSACSDGREAPEYVAARTRELGMDFIAVTDHHRYAPSLEAAAVWSKLPTDLRIYPGEEVHSPDNCVHIINFGGSFSVNELARSDRYRREVSGIAGTMAPVTTGCDPFPVAASEWVFDRIREGGGLAVFCHPYWQQEQYCIDEGITTEILNRRKFDALELLGGFYPHQWTSNCFQVARWSAELARGNSFPVVGLSDSHGVDRDPERERLAGWYSTLAFARSSELGDLVGAMRSGSCVAIGKVGSGLPQIYGEFRLVKFAGFLLENYFPRHDELCAVEGRLMVNALAGDRAAVAALGALSGRTAGYLESCYA